MRITYMLLYTYSMLYKSKKLGKAEWRTKFFNDYIRLTDETYTVLWSPAENLPPDVNPLASSK